jgi:hypothetical protein
MHSVLHCVSERAPDCGQKKINSNSGYRTSRQSTTSSNWRLIWKLFQYPLLFAAINNLTNGNSVKRGLFRVFKISATACVSVHVFPICLSELILTNSLSVNVLPQPSSLEIKAENLYPSPSDFGRRGQERALAFWSHPCF